MMEATRVTVDEVKERMGRGEQFVFLDTRNPEAWGESESDAREACFSSMLHARRASVASTLRKRRASGDESASAVERVLRWPHLVSLPLENNATCYTAHGQWVSDDRDAAQPRRKIYFSADSYQSAARPQDSPVAQARLHALRLFDRAPLLARIRPDQFPLVLRLGAAVDAAGPVA